MAVVAIKLEGQDNASDKIKKVQKNLDDLGKNAGKQIDLGSITDQLGSLGSGTGAIEAIGGALGAALPVAGLGVAAAAVSGMSWELGKAGAEALRTRDSFEKLAQGAGMSGQALLAAMRTASQGTVADSELMLAANRAIVLGVSQNTEQIAALTATAIQRGRDVGVGAAQAVSDLFTGIGRMSPEILDNLGIAGAKQAFDDYAKTIGTTADKLSDVQKKQALVNAVLQSGGGSQIANDAASSFERMDAAIQNAKDALGIMFSPAITVIAQKLAEAAQGVTSEIEKSQKAAAYADMAAYGDSLNRVLATYQKWQNALAVAQVEGDTSGIKNALANLDMYGTSLQGIAEDYNKAAKVTGAPLIDIAQLKNGVVAHQELGVAIQGTTVAATTNSAALDRVRASLAALQGQADATGNSLRSAWLGAAGALGAAQALSGFQEQQKVLSSLRQEWYYMGLEGDEVAFRESQFLAHNNSLIQDQEKAITDATSAMQAHGSAVSAVEKQYNDLSGKVSSALQGATSLDPIGVNPTDFLPRADAVQEDAFRLADVMVNGFNSPWAAYFKDKFPAMWDEITAGGDVQAGAAKVLEQFQQGLRPELLNFDQLKESVKQQLLSEQAFAGMGKQITDQLVAELGVSAGDVQSALGGVVGSLPGGQALADKVTGGEDLTGSGNKAGGSFMTGFGATASGGAIVTTITTQITAALGQFDTSGRTAGTKWSAGFYASVETGLAPDVIKLLAVLVTPEVLAQLKLQQSQTGTQD